MPSYDILQWNCLGLRTRAEELKILMRDHNPGIVCLQETKLGNYSFNPGLNYKIYNSMPPPGDRAHGGAAIIINKSIQHSVIQLNTTFQVVAIKAILEKAITICSIYLPGAVGFTTNTLQNLINQLPPPFILLGDFNAHNPLWGGNYRDMYGNILENILNSNDIILYNDGSMTYHNIHTNTFSAIDLSICSSNIATNFNWSVNNYLHGSDHYPIHLKYSENVPSSSPPKWKEKDADWDKYRQGIRIDREFESFPTHLEAYSYLKDKIINSAEDSIPKTGNQPRRPAVPWWDKKCSVLRKVTRKCYRRFKNSGSQTTKLIYQRALAKKRRYYRKAKRESWLYYINGISSKTPSRCVWRKIRKLSGKFVPSPLPTLKINNNLITNPDEVANTLGRHFSEVSSPNNYPEEFQRIRNSQVAIDFTSNSYEAYNTKFSLQELHSALSSTEDTSPGEDGILYSMIRHLPEEAKLFLLKIINKIWETGVLPRSWKISIIIPVQKPFKDPFQPTSYRPIALTSCICKLMEKMINTRLVWYLESKSLLSDHQYGFRKNRSTLDPLLKLSNEIQLGFANSKQTIGVFFDMEKAYDTTWRHGVIKKFYKMGVRGKMLRFLNSFLSNRYFKVRVGSTLSSSFCQEEGVPQGSVLSVTCFAVAINGIVDALGPRVKGSLFVDDFVIYTSAYDALSACRDLQRSINSVSRWALNNGFRFSTTKTVAVRFTRSRRQEEIPNLILNGEILPYEDEVKFLGIIFDKKLTWSSHIDNLKRKVRKSLDILKVVSSFDWGADKKSLLRLYDSLCRSKLDYGCQIYSSACKTKLKELDVVHNMGLRICSGAFRTSPVESIYIDCHQLPLDLRREELGLRYVARVQSSPENPSLNLINETLSKNYRANAMPFHVRYKDHLGNGNLLNEQILPVKFPKNPPWMLDIKRCTTGIVKKNSTPEEVHAKFSEHDQQHTKDFKIFTDGSKSTDGVGCAIVTRDLSRLGRLPNSASSFTAELTGIVHALKEASKVKANNVVIYTDSKSAIDAISQFNTFHPIAQKAQEWLHLIRARHKTVCFCWVPSHVGIRGNEIADSEAKDASKSRRINLPKLPHYDVYNVIKSHIKLKWQARWSDPLLANNRKYKDVRPSVSFWPSAYHSNRRDEIVLSRLRIGHTYLTHKFLLEGSDAPECDYCGGPITVEHILAHCHRYIAARRKYGLAGKSIQTILNDDADIDSVLKFLKEIDIYHKI